MKGDLSRTHWLFSALLALVLIVPGAEAATKKLVRDVRVSETIFIEPADPEDMVVWLRVRNTSAQHGVDPKKLQNLIAAQLLDGGYQITKKPREAFYQLQINIRIAERVPSNWSAEAGVAAGLVANKVAKDDGKRTGDAAGIGLASGAIVAGIGKAFEKVKYGLVIDVRLSEAIGGVQTTRMSGDMVGKIQVEGDTNLKATAAVNRSRAGSTSQIVERKEKYLHHQTVIAAFAQARRLKQHEALPLLMEDVTSALVNML